MLRGSDPGLCRAESTPSRTGSVEGRTIMPPLRSAADRTTVRRLSWAAAQPRGPAPRPVPSGLRKRTPGTASMNFQRSCSPGIDTQISAGCVASKGKSCCSPGVRRWAEEASHECLFSKRAKNRIRDIETSFPHFNGCRAAILSCSARCSAGWHCLSVFPSVSQTE